MCTYATVRIPIEASAKGPNSGWFRASEATVYFDHPVHASAEHTLNVDLPAPAHGPAARVAIEMTGESARALVEAIQTALASAPPELTVA